MNTLFSLWVSIQQKLFPWLNYEVIGNPIGFHISIPTFFLAL
jgi:hypothetical protein